MNESPIEAIRTKPLASLIKCVDLVSNGQADIFVSAGHTGAIVAATTLKWGFLEGIKRPGIAVPFPTSNGICYLIDAGANIYCNPIHLLQYGIMASVYCREVNKISQPRIGLLNIGQEDSKGNQLVKESLKLFKKTPLNFIGNIEGQHIWEGNCDIVVCEGFIGNIILKSAEGLAEFIAKFLLKEIGPTYPALNETIRQLKNKTDYAVYGGAPLLGVNGKVIICHGRSRREAIMRAIEVADNFARQKVNEEIVKALKQIPLSWLDILKSWRTVR